MAVSRPVDLDTRRLRDEIRSIYARVADNPNDEFHFHRGPDYAAEFLRYDRAALAELPDASVAVQRTAVVPTGNVLPLDGLQLTVGLGSTTSLAVGRA